MADEISRAPFRIPCDPRLTSGDPKWALTPRLGTTATGGTRLGHFLLKVLQAAASHDETWSHLSIFGDTPPAPH